MRKIMDEIIYDLRKNNFFFFLLAIQLIVCMIVSFVTATLYSDTISTSENAQQKLEKVSYHRIFDNLVEEYETQFFSKENYLAKLKNMYLSLVSSDAFEYLEIYMQPVEINDNNIPETFLYGYERGDEGYSVRSSMNLNGEKQTSYNVKCFWISENVQSSFDMTCSDGKLFQSDDFAFDSMEIPVLLGDEYKNMFEIGEVLSGNIMIKTPINLKVIGFLDKGSYLYHYGRYENLDRYLLLPSVNMNSIPESALQIMEQKILYLMKINGTLKSSQSLENLQLDINRICESSGIVPYSYVDGAPNIQSYMFNSSITEIQAFVRMLALMLLIFSFITLILYTILKIEKNLKYYAVLQLSGFSVSEICKVVVGNIIAILLISDLISVPVSLAIIYMLGIKATFTYIFIMINFGILFATTIVVVSKFKSYELIDFLREE